MMICRFNRKNRLNLKLNRKFSSASKFNKNRNLESLSYFKILSKLEIIILKLVKKYRDKLLQLHQNLVYMLFLSIKAKLTKFLQSKVMNKMIKHYHHINSNLIFHLLFTALIQRLSYPSPLKKLLLPEAQYLSVLKSHHFIWEREKSYSYLMKMQMLKLILLMNPCQQKYTKVGQFYLYLLQFLLKGKSFMPQLLIFHQFQALTY